MIIFNRLVWFGLVCIFKMVVSFLTSTEEGAKADYIKIAIKCG